MRGERINELDRTVYHFNHEFLDQSHLLRRNGGETIHADDVNIDDFKSLLRYCFPSPNSNSQVNHRCYSKVSNKQYLADAICATKLNATRKDIKKKKDKNGVKGLSLFAALQYFSYKSHTCFDPFHCILNCGKHILRRLCGTRAKGDKVKAYCRKHGTHRSLHEGNQIPPWEIHLDSMKHTITTWVNCILVPLGYKNKFQVKHVLKKDGFLRGTAIVDIVCNLLDYMLSADPQYSQEYRLFFHLFSSAASKMLATKIVKSTYSKLCKIIIEVIALHELMFPATEASFCFHQMVDIVHHIPETGPTRGISTLANERALKLLKSFLPVGGGKPEFTTFNRYNAYEYEATNQHYDPSKTELLSPENYFHHVDGTLCYTDEPFLLQQPLWWKDNLFQTTTDEAEEILNAIKQCVEIKSRFLQKKALQNSVLYRIYASYLHRLSYDETSEFNSKKKATNKTNKLSLKQWAMAIVEAYNESNDSYFREQAYHFVYSAPADHQDIVNEIVSRGGVYEVDIPIIKDFILHGNFKINHTMYSKATVFGTSFRARGYEKREKTNVLATVRWGSTEFGPKLSNEANRLSKHWYETDDYSSWCRIKTPDIDNYMYGQINSFMQLHIPVDPYVDGMCVASITTRKHITHNFVDYILGDEDQLSLNTKLFVPVVSIVATPVLTVGFSSENSKPKLDFTRSENRLMDFLTNNNDRKPIYAGKRFKEDIEFSSCVANSSGLPPSAIRLAFLALIPMQRERENCCYEATKTQYYQRPFHGEYNVFMRSLQINTDFVASNN